MSLRSFHLFFISLSAVMTAFCSAWSFSQWETGHQLVYGAGALASAASVAGLAVYGVTFQRKTRDL